MAGHNNYFGTNEIREFTNPQLKNSKPITTIYPPANYPTGLTLLDYNYGKDIRIKSYFDNVKFNEKNEAFDSTIHLDAWDDSIMYTTQCTWFDTFKHDRDFQHGKLTLKPDEFNSKKFVSFPTEFSSQPWLILWLSGFDVGHTGHWRFSVDHFDVTKKGFNIVGATWGTTKLNSLEATWIAYPASRSNIDSGWFHTDDVRDWQKPQFNNSKTFEFRKKFERVPKVFFALSRIDSFHNDNEKFNLRVRAHITDTTTKGMTVHLDSWGENNMYSSLGQWIAVEEL